MTHMTDRTTCTDEMLDAAVRKAVELGLLPKSSPLVVVDNHAYVNTVVDQWLKIRAVVEAALAADSRCRPEPNPVPPGERWIEVRP